MSEGEHERGRRKRMMMKMRKKTVFSPTKLRNRCYWWIDFNRCLQLWRWLHQWMLSNLFQFASSCGLNTGRKLIDTHGINNNIQRIICSAELKTAIVSPMDCGAPPWESNSVVHLQQRERRNILSLSFLFLSFALYLVHSWFLCGQCCTHRCPSHRGRGPHTEDRNIEWQGHHTQCPSNRCSKDSAPWCTGRYHCRELGRRLRRSRGKFREIYILIHYVNKK